MAFDGVFTHYIVEELTNNLLFGRINKIYQLSDYELVFVVRANNATQKLLLSIHPNYARVHITESDYTYPKEPPMFCMLLRKHLEGGIITGISQKDNDRIILFDIEYINEIGDKDRKQLIVEIMGKHSNIVLINYESKRILDSIKHVSPFLNSVRTLQPGADYIFPPTQDKINFFHATKEDFHQFNYEKQPLHKQFVDYFEGVSPLCAKEIISLAEFVNSESMYHAYLQFTDLLKNRLQPSIITTNSKDYFYLYPLNSIGGETKTYDTLGQLLDRFYFQKDEHERIKQKTQDLEKFIKNELEKYKNKLDNLETDLQMAKDAEIYKLYGELIVTYSYQLEKGMQSCKLENYYENNELIEIELNPLLTPIENSQKYFSKYQKGKKAIGHLNLQIYLTKQEIEYFETLNEQIKTASVKDALEIRQELEDGRYLKRNLSKKKKQIKPQYETYLVDDIELLVGKNNLQNEYLTFQVARKNDTWMHVKDMPGSHVIIRTTELTENIIRSAANLAAYYSKGKDSSSVPVDYTLVRHVKKISGAKPGFVSYENQKTIFIDPDEDFILSLAKK